MLLLVLFDRVDRADPGVIQGRRRPRLALEPLQRLGVVLHVRGQELEGHAAAELRVLGLVNDTHPTTSEPADDGVVLDGLPDVRVHVTTRLRPP